MGIQKQPSVSCEFFSPVSIQLIKKKKNPVFTSVDFHL